MDWIERLGLERHPEGGWFRATYRAEATIDRRSLATSIYFLLRPGEVSRVHRLRSDELWFHHRGGVVVLHLFAEDGPATFRLGADAGAEPQARVPGGTWFGAELEGPERAALVGCVVAPGFDFRDFELARREELVARFPGRRDVIARLT